MNIIILSDDIRGHFHQSLGVAKWLERLADAHIENIISVPKFKGFKKFLTLKISARALKNQNISQNDAQKWLNNAGFKIPDIDNNTLFISTGSSAAPFCLALARATGNKCAVIMTPSVLGIKPFDFAVIPEHDAGKNSDALITLGAPNHIYKPDLENEAAKKFDYVHEKKIIALLLGGSDANYKIDSEWVIKNLTPLANNFNDAGILITTSRRTGIEADSAVKKIFTGHAEYLLLASENPDENPVPAMLGRATHVLVTEDSVSMASEAVTAGFKVGLLRVKRTDGALKKFFGYGAIRFDAMFEKMIERNLIIDLGNEPDYEKFLNTPEQKHNQDFNEAKRAAEYILKKL